jgi:hypothetical protein
MCNPKAPGAGKRLTTASGVIYYPNTPEGDIAMRADMAATMGAAAGEDSQPATRSIEPDNNVPKDCAEYTDAMWDTKCSKYFRYSNMTRQPVNGSVDKKIGACNWKALCENVLDPIKEQFPGMTISSGFRPTSFNGSTSDHTKGKGADIQLQGDAVEGAKKMFKWIGASGLPFSQLIFEGRWVHVAYNGATSPSIAVLVTRNGAAPYQNGGGRAGTALPPDLRWA